MPYILFRGWSLFLDFFQVVQAFTTTLTQVLRRESMTEEVLVTRKGQTTIPASLRKKYKISEGTRLKVQDTGSGILFKKVPSTIELIGSGAKHATVEDMKRRLDEMRREENEWQRETHRTQGFLLSFTILQIEISRRESKKYCSDLNQTTCQQPCCRRSIC